MQLYEEMISKQIGAFLLAVLENSHLNYTKILEIKSLEALQKIKAIIHDDSLSDFDCVERIVCVFEEIGSSGGARHDF